MTSPQNQPEQLSGNRRRNFLREAKSMLARNETASPVLKWYKVAKRIIEIIAPSGLHWDKK